MWPWPPICPGLSPAEDLWDVLKSEVAPLCCEHRGARDHNTALGIMESYPFLECKVMNVFVGSSQVRSDKRTLEMGKLIL